MKHTIKKMKLFLYIFTGMMILNACTFEKEAIKQNGNERFIIKSKKFEDLIEDKKVGLLVKKLHDKAVKIQDIQNRSIYSEENDFIIDTEKSIYIEDSESTYKSYTFKVMRHETKNNDYIENLVLSFPAEGFYKLNLLRYKLTEIEKIAINSGEKIELFDNEVTSISIDDNVFGAELSEKMLFVQVGDCFSIVETSCSYHNSSHPDGMLPNGSQCPGYHEQVIWTFCNETGDGTAGPSNNIGDNTNPTPIGETPEIGNGSSSGNGGNGANNPVVTTQIADNDDFELEDTTPCEKLKQLTDNQQFKDKLTFLKTYTTTGIEYAVEMEKMSTPEGVIYDKFTLVTNNDKLFVSVDTGGYIFGNAHNHPKKGQSIPSWGDVRWLRNCEKNRQVRRNIGFAVNIVVVRNTQSNTPPCYIYAIKIDDFNILEQQLANDIAQYPKIEAMTDKDAQRDEMNKKIGEKFNPFHDNTDGLEKAFLEQFSNHGISLYKLDESNSSWSKLQLQNPYNPNSPNSPNNVLSIPCSN